MPLCAIKNNAYINFLTGEVITDDNILQFIHKNINNGNIKIEILVLNIYEIGYIDENKKFSLISYNCEINGHSNYLTPELKLISEEKRRILFNRIIKGKYLIKLKWKNGENI